jgi:hypothetical protein
MVALGSLRSGAVAFWWLLEPWRVVQPAERLTLDQEVGGSSPPPPATNVQLAVLKLGGRWNRSGCHVASCAAKLRGRRRCPRNDAAPETVHLPALGRSLDWIGQCWARWGSVCEALEVWRGIQDEDRARLGEA